MVKQSSRLEEAVRALLQAIDRGECRPKPEELEAIAWCLEKQGSIYLAGRVRALEQAR